MAFPVLIFDIIEFPNNPSKLPLAFVTNILIKLLFKYNKSFTNIGAKAIAQRPKKI